MRQTTTPVPATPRWPPRLLGGTSVGLALAAALWAQRTVPLPPIPHLARHPVSNIAHAGASGHAPANTLPAFEAALALGANALEMDLQLTADGHVVVIHDGSVDATTDGTGRVSDLSLDQLKQLDAGYRFAGPTGEYPYRGQEVTVPTLGEVFEAFPDQFIIIDLKTDGGQAIVEAVADVVVDRGRDRRVLVASFDVDYLRAFRERVPAVPTNMAEDEIRSFRTLYPYQLHRWFRPPGAVFQVPEYFDGTYVVTPRFVAAAHDLGIGVHVWTVNDPADFSRLIGLGVDGIITDYPDRLAAILGR